MVYKVYKGVRKVSIFEILAYSFFILAGLGTLILFTGLIISVWKDWLNEWRSK